MLRNILIAAGMLGLAYVLVDMPPMLMPACALNAHTPIGLLQIISSPFCHPGGWEHFNNNARIFVVFAPLIIFSEPNEDTFGRVTIAAMAGSGLLVWFLSPIGGAGMSGVVYGYLGFLVARVLAKRDFMSLAIAIGCGVYYWYQLANVTNGTGNVSWEAHLGGLIGGAVAALCLPARQARVMASAEPRTA